jgi:hypothetical protein
MTNHPAEMRHALGVALSMAELTRAHQNFAERGLSLRTVEALWKAGIEFPERLLFATREQLASLPGIGRAGLADIHNYRERFGRFEIDRVKGRS